MSDYPYPTDIDEMDDAQLRKAVCHLRGRVAVLESQVQIVILNSASRLKRLVTLEQLEEMREEEMAKKRKTAKAAGRKASRTARHEGRESSRKEKAEERALKGRRY